MHGKSDSHVSHVTVPGRQAVEAAEAQADKEEECLHHASAFSSSSSSSEEKVTALESCDV